MKHAKQIAEHATIQSFLNCYLRETGSGEWITEDKRIEDIFFHSKEILALLIYAVGYRHRTLLCMEKLYINQQQIVICLENNFIIKLGIVILLLKLIT